MPIAFFTWYALLNNFVKEVAAFDGADIGLLHTVREIPGFLAFLVIYLIAVVIIGSDALSPVALFGAFSVVQVLPPLLANRIAG